MIRPSPTPPRSSPIVTSSTARCAGSTREQRAVVVLRFYLELSLPETADGARHPARDRRSPASTGRSRRCASPSASDDDATPARDHAEGQLRMTPTIDRDLSPASSPRVSPTSRGASAPDYRDDILRQVARTRQRPAWTFLERWLPMTVITRPGLAPPLRMAWLLLIALLCLALAAGVAIVGSRLLTSNGPDDGLAATAVIPQGDEAVFAFATWIGAGDIYTVRADGTDLRQLTEWPGHRVRTPRGRRTAPASPTGTRQDGSDTLVVMDAGGGKPDHRGHERCSCPVLRGALERGVVAGRDEPHLPRPRRLPADTTSSSWRPTARRRRRGCLSPGRTACTRHWSPDGTQIAFVGSEDERQHRPVRGGGGAGGALDGRAPAHIGSVPSLVRTWPTQRSRTAMVTRWDGAGCARTRGHIRGGGGWFRAAPAG